MTLTMMLSATASIMFLFTSHPLSMGLILLAQTLLISMMTGTLAQNFWYSYIIFIVMVGGMLVLFIYMTSVASNEKFNISPPMIISSATMMASLTMISWTKTDKFVPMKNSEMSNFNIQDQIIFTMNKYLNLPSNLMMFFLMIYLLITLIAVVKITNITYGPLRQKF